MKLCSDGLMNKMERVFFLGFIISVLSLTSCPRKAVSPKTVLLRIDWDQLKLSEDFEKDGIPSLIEAVRTNLLWLQERPQKRFRFGLRIITAEEIIPFYQDFLDELSDTKKAGAYNIIEYLKSRFDLYKARTDAQEDYVRYTGYYLPEIQGSLRKSKRYSVPVYSTPKDLVTINLRDFDDDLPNRCLRGRVQGDKLVPYWTREEINSKKQIEKQGVEIAWVKSLVDLFFVEIQGSGVIRLRNGKKMLIGYDQKNGHPYRAIGNLLVRENHFPKEEMSMQRIRRWLANNPDKIERVLNHNPSFIFFRKKPDGPYGNINIALVPKRSLAADQRYYPPCALTIVDLPKPRIAHTGEIEASEERLQHLAFINDTGGAIKGSDRIDIYWGAGEEAGDMAGITNHDGHLYVLVPKQGLTLAPTEEKKELINDNQKAALQEVKTTTSTRKQADSSEQKRNNASKSRNRFHSRRKRRRLLRSKKKTIPKKTSRTAPNSNSKNSPKEKPKTVSKSNTKIHPNKNNASQTEPKKAQSSQR